MHCGRGCRKPLSDCRYRPPTLAPDWYRRRERSAAVMPRVIVSLTADRVHDIDAVVDALRRAGLTAVTVLRAVGVVIGDVEPDGGAARLAAVPGVRAVEPERQIEGW